MSVVVFPAGHSVVGVIKHGADVTATQRGVEEMMSQGELVMMSERSLCPL